MNLLFWAYWHRQLPVPSDRKRIASSLSSYREISQKIRYTAAKPQICYIATFEFRNTPLPLATLSTADPPAISCRNLSLSFGPKSKIISDLNLHIESGQIVTLLGPSGCGKSTLLKLIAKLLVPQQGSISVDADSTTNSNPRISFVFQEPTLLPWRTAFSNVRLPWRLSDRADGAYNAPTSFECWKRWTTSERLEEIPKSALGWYEDANVAGQGLDH